MPALNRRSFLAASGAALAGGGMVSAASAASQPGVGKKRPNLLVILTDDQGYGDLSCYGAPDLRTPHLDRLAAEGMRFDRFYANCPVCSPTRASLLTGRYPELVGVPGVIRTHPDNSWGHLTPDARLLPALLKPAGYTTAIVGKWHLGLEAPNTPNERGFDLFRGFLGDMMDDYFTHRRHDINYMRHNRDVIDPQGHATDLFTDWACEYLRARKGEAPFCLYLAYNAPHMPIQPPQEWLERVRRRLPELPEKRAKMVALIEHLDDGIGRVLKSLRETGLERDTLVAFVSDNGGDLPAGAYNGHVRFGKGTLYEGGIRVPMAARWPGRIAPGSRSQRTALTMDLTATLLDAAGVSVPGNLDGRSFLPALRGETQPEPERDLFWGRREKFGGQGGTIEGMRRGDWKLLRSRPAGPWELYDLRADPLEQTDLAAREPAKTRELVDVLERQLERYRAVPWQAPGA